MNKSLAYLLVLFVFLCTSQFASMQQQPGGGGQMADPNFDATVAKPAYKSKGKKTGPKVLFDEAHNNFHTASGRYKPFADLVTNDGYQIKVITFTGQSLKGPADSTAFMKLADTAQDVMRGQNINPVSAAGRAQGIAMNFGKGRVIVLGEAGMLSAQVIVERQLKFGMNRAGIDNRQLALNIMHWLSGVLK